MEVLICTGDRDAFQLVDDQVTVLYPRKGVSDLARMTPAAVEEKYGVAARAATATSPRWSARPATTCPACPGVGDEDRRQVDQPVRRRSTGVVARVDEIKGKAGDSLREHLADVMRNYELNRWSATWSCRCAPTDAALARLGPRGGAPGLRHPAVPGPARPALPVPGGGRAGGRVRLRPRPARCSPSPARWPAWLAEHAPAGTPVGVAVDRHGSAAGTGDAHRARAGHRRRRRPPGSTRPQLDADRRAARWPRWLADPSGPRCARRQGPMLAFAAHGWQLAGLDRDTALAAYLARPDQRSYDLADLALRYLHRELRVDAPDDRPAHPRRARRRRRRPSRT